VPNTGGGLEGTGGRSPQNLRWGTAYAFVPRNISRSSVIGCVAKSELTKRGVMENLFCSKIEVFCQENGHIGYVTYQISDSSDRQKTEKIRSMAKRS